MCNEKCKKHKAKRAERIGVGVAKRLALVQAVIWAKRTEAGDICELDPLLVEEATCTRTVSSTLVDELAHQGHLLVRHNKRLRCKVCNVYRANRQFRFWSRHPCFPRPSAAVVISQFRHKKRQHISTSVGNSCHVLGQSGERSKTSNKHDEKELHHWVVRISSAHTATWNFSLCLLPLNLKLISHTLINVVITPSLKLPSRVAKVSMFCRNCMVVAWRARGGKLLPLRTLLDPELHYGQISITQKDGTPPVPRRNAHNGTWYIAWHLLLVAQSFCVVLLAVLGLVRSLWWKMGTMLGRSQLHVGPVGSFSRARTPLESRVESPLLPGLKSQVCRLGAKRCVNSLGVKWKQYCRPLWAPVRPASRSLFLLVSLLQVNTPLFLVCLLAHLLCPCAKHVSRGLCGNSWIRRSGVGATCPQRAGVFLFWSSGHK